MWLNEALASMSVNVTDTMKSSLRILMEEGINDEEVPKQVEAFKQILEWVDNTDLANDFHKVGGDRILHRYLQNPHASLRELCAVLVGELVQNNPYWQEVATTGQLLPTLLDLVDKDPMPTVQLKALYAVSGLTRDNPRAQLEFGEKLEGFSVLMRAMQRQDEERLKVKAAFMLSTLCRQQTDFKDTLCNMGFVDQLVALIQEEHSVSHEHLLAALLALATDHEKTLRECQRPELGLHQLLTNRLQLIDDKEEYEEEKEACQQLLQMCFDNGTSDLEEVLPR
jgi:hsp70-interacting protein